MITESLVCNGSFPIPKLLINKADISLFTEEFRGFHAQFADSFSREEPRRNFYQYMAGQMSQLERKSIEPIALNAESAKVTAMQHFLSDIVWEEERILSRYQGMVSEDLGDAEGLLIFDESGFVKKGNDSVYGSSPEFLEAVEKAPGVTYIVALPRDTLCWLQAPAILEKTYRYGGKKRMRRVLEETEKKPVTFEKIARGTNDYFWYRRTLSEGTKGPVTYEFMKRRVVLTKDGQPDRTAWLIVRRTIGEGAAYSYFISNANRSTCLKTFVWLSGVRWAIEQCFEEAKSDLGMDHYEVRKFPGWRQHMLTCMLAHFFLWPMRIRLGEKSASDYAVTA